MLIIKQPRMVSELLTHLSCFSKVCQLLHQCHRRRHHPHIPLAGLKYLRCTNWIKPLNNQHGVRGRAVWEGEDSSRGWRVEGGNQSQMLLYETCFPYSHQGRWLPWFFSRENVFLRTNQTWKNRKTFVFLHTTSLVTRNARKGRGGWRSVGLTSIQAKQELI